MAYFSLAMKTVKIPHVDIISNNLRKKLGNLSDKDNNLIVYLIGQLGRDSKYATNMISGNQMLQDCYNVIGMAREAIGGRVILLECKPKPSLCKFYGSQGYIDITENETGLKQYMKFIDQ